MDPSATFLQKTEATQLRDLEPLQTTGSVLRAMEQQTLVEAAVPPSLVVAGEGVTLVGPQELPVVEQAGVVIGYQALVWLLM